MNGRFSSSVNNFHSAPEKCFYRSYYYNQIRGGRRDSPTNTFATFGKFKFTSLNHCADRRTKIFVVNIENLNRSSTNCMQNRILLGAAKIAYQQ